MNIRKSLPLVLASMAIGLCALSSPASAAVDGVLRHTNGNLIANGTTLHFVGLLAFGNGSGAIECHATVTAEATSGTSLKVNQLNITTSKCKGLGAFVGCTVTSDTVKNLPYQGTVTPTDFDITGNIVILNTLSSCVFGFTKANLSLAAITLIPLKTGTTVVTNTSNNLGTAAAGVGEPIAGVTIEGVGNLEIDTTTLAVALVGDLELTSPERCTYKLASS